MRRALLALLVCLAWPAWASLPLDGMAAPPVCAAAAAYAERAGGVPAGLLAAINLVESGRRDERSGQMQAWPWTINVEGVGHFYPTKADAMAAVRGYQAQGIRSIDVGCSQVNLMHHPNAFASLEEAFDPVGNARYAATFLNQLYAQTGTWPKAAAGYHSLTPDIGADYARKVLAIWTSGGGLAPAGSGAPFSGGGFAPTAVASSMALPGSTTARILPLPGASTSLVTGRSLDAYRASPTRLAAQFGFGRRS